MIEEKDRIAMRERWVEGKAGGGVVNVGSVNAGGCANPAVKIRANGKASRFSVALPILTVTSSGRNVGGAGFGVPGPGEDVAGRSIQNGAYELQLLYGSGTDLQYFIVTGTKESLQDMTKEVR